MWIPESFATKIAPARAPGDAAASPVARRLTGMASMAFTETRTSGCELDVVATRGEIVESTHRVHAAVVSADGVLLEAVRDPGLVVWWRSCAKPFQAMPFLRSGGFDELGWGVDELALACASHGGEPEHVLVVARMLERLGLEEGDLACGPHEPLSVRGSRHLRDVGDWPSRLHNNCSGKHAAMLARARQIGVSTTGYERADHQVQRDCRHSVSDWTGMDPDGLAVGVDGCGVSVFALPLANMALAYARLVRAAVLGDQASRRVVSAMTGQPFLVGGTDRFDTLLMDACGGNVVCKIGAEGVHCLAIVDQGIGCAIKVEDGNSRAQFPAVLALLDAYGALPQPLPETLVDFARRPVRNTRGEQVGAVMVEHVGIGGRLI